MNRMKKLILATSLSTMLCTSCNTTKIEEVTGEWGIDDFIYIKCMGNEVYPHDPTGWLHLNEETYTFTISSVRNYYYFYYDEDSPKYKLKDLTIWYTHITILRDNRMKIQINQDKAGGIYEGKYIYLYPIDQQ